MNFSVQSVRNQRTKDGFEKSYIYLWDRVTVRNCNDNCNVGLLIYLKTSLNEHPEGNGIEEALVTRSLAQNVLGFSQNT